MINQLQQCFNALLAKDLAWYDKPIHNKAS